MDKVKKWKCSKCGFPASDAGIVRAHQGRIHHGFGTIEHNDTQVIDMTTERPDGTQGDLESPKGSPAEALRQQIEEIIGVTDFDLSEPYDKALDTIMQLVTAYAATVEREARIDEMEKSWSNGRFDAMTTEDGKHWHDADQCDGYVRDRLAALQGPIQDDSK